VLYFISRDDQTQQNDFALYLALAICLKTVLFIVTFGAKVPCGAFIPSMAIGSCFGRLVAIAMQSLKDSSPDNLFFSSCHPDTLCINPGTYAMLGAAAFLGGVTRMTGKLRIMKRLVV
jgi:chloride channel 3/4/5